MKFGHEWREEPFQLANAGLSHDYIDGKRAIAKGSRYQLVAEAIVAMAAERGVEFDAVGGMTMGADPIAVAVAVRTDAWWFSVRKEAKKHGKLKRIEGAELTEDTRVLLVDDVITTGGSTLSALDAVEEAGASVVLVTTLVDRSDMAGKALEARGVNYEPLLTYSSLGIEPVASS
ncbi:MAG: orotate phosphoribosyltransferase [Actinomycetota bacterium]